MEVAIFIGKTISLPGSWAKMSQPNKSIDPVRQQAGINRR